MTATGSHPTPADLSAAASIQSRTRLLTPGPTAVPEAVLLEMAQPIIHHRTKAFKAIFREVSDRLKWLYRTEHPILTIAGSGTTSYEAAQVSLLPPGGKALTIAGGKFGERWQDIYDAYASSHGFEQIRINVPWGEAVQPGQIHVEHHQITSLLLLFPPLQGLPGIVADFNPATFSC
jgi:aspartate aminotransferase-like enzyme